MTAAANGNSGVGKARAEPSPRRQPVADRAALPVKRRWLLTIGIMAAMVMQILDTTIANVALPHMQASLGATLDTISWVLTSYIIASAVAIPITGWLSNRVGSRNLFLAAIAGFIVASMLCGIATSIEEMVAFRMLQGIAAAFINPLSQTAMLDINEPSRQAKAMSIWGMGVMVGPILGPLLGGWLTEYYNWRWVFYVNLPIGIFTFTILWFLLPARPRAPRSFDMLGFSMLAIGFGAFQLMLDRGQQQDWFRSWEIIAYLGLTLAAFWVFAIHMVTGRHPLFDRRLFANRNLMVGVVIMFFVGIYAMAPLALVPQMLQQLFGYPVIDTGLVTAPRGIGMLVTMWLAGRLMTKVDGRYLIMFGLALYAFSLWQMAQWSLAVDSRHIIAIGVLQGLAVGFVFMPLNALAFSTLGPEARTDGASLFNLMRSVGSSAGISLVTTFIARNVQTSHSDLASHVTQATLPPVDQSLVGSLAAMSEGAFALIDAELSRQAVMIAYIDDYYMVAIICLATLPLVALFRRGHKKLERIHLE